MLLALFALQLLSVSTTGLALIVLGTGLLIAAHFVPGFGILGIGGVVAFVTGSIVLIDTDVPGYRISRLLIGVAAATSAAFVLVVLNLAIRARQRPVVSGREQILGASGAVLDDIDGDVFARIHGELWKVCAGIPLVRGQMVRVLGIDGLLLTVEPIRKEGDEK